MQEPQQMFAGVAITCEDEVEFHEAFPQIFPFRRQAECGFQAKAGRIGIAPGRPAGDRVLRAAPASWGAMLQVSLIIADRRLKTLFVLGLAGPLQHESHLAMKLELVQEVNRLLPAG